MSLDGLLHFPWLDADVPLGNSSAAVLEKLLYQGDIVMTIFIDLGGIVLPEAMGTDIPIAQVVTDGFEMPLNRPLGQQEDPAIFRNPLIQAVAADELIKCQRHREHPGLSGFLFRNSQTIPFSVLDNIAEPELQDIGDPQPQVGLQHQGCGNLVMGAGAGNPFFHDGDYLLILLCGQRYGSFVHALLPPLL